MIPTTRPSTSPPPRTNKDGNKATDKLTGLFFIKDKGDAYITGRIVSRAEEGYYLLQFDDINNIGVDMPMEIMDICQMTLVEDGIPVMSLFTTREALDAYLEWMNTPSKPVVMALVPKEPK